MLEFLPVAVFLLLFQLFRSHLGGVRLAFLAAAVTWAAYATVLSEALGAFHLLERTQVAVLWSVAGAALLYAVARARRPALRLDWRSLDPLSRALAAVIAALAAILAVTALNCPPNTYDVAAYHLPRILMWVQDRSLAFFPTHMANMNFMPPGNEILQLQFVLLGRGDLLANCTQWFAWLGTLAAVSLALQRLGGGARVQWTGAFLAACLPEAVLVATGAKNDVTLTFWLLTSFALALVLRDETNPIHAALLGLAIGLALLTKSLAWFLLPSFGLALLAIFPRAAWLASFRQLPILLAMVLAVAGPFWLRSAREYGSITGPRLGHRDMPFGYQCERFTPAGVAANLVRNTAVQFNIGPPAVHDALDRAFRSAVATLGQDPDDPASLWPGTKFHLQPFYWGEGGISNTAHLLLFLGLAIAAAVRPRRPVLALWAAAAVAFFLFSAYLRWQPWHTRLHLAIFAFASIPAGWMLGRLPARWTAAPLLACIGAVALYAATQNTLRPLTGPFNVLDTPRTDSLFAERRADGPNYQAAIAAIAATGCRRVGVIGGYGHFYYPAFLLLGVLDGEREVRMLMDDQGRLQPANFQPCAIFCTECAGYRPRTALLQSLGYQSRDFAAHQVWLRPEPPR